MMGRIMPKITFLLLILLTLLACSRNGRDREFYGNISETPGGLALVDPNEHQGGWGRPQCLVCHNADLNIHRGPYSVLNAEALNVLIRNNGLSAYCLGCHSNNGIQP